MDICSKLFWNFYKWTIVIGLENCHKCMYVCFSESWKEEEESKRNGNFVIFIFSIS